MTPRVSRLGLYDLHCLAVETAARPLHVGVLAVLDARGRVEGSGLVDAVGLADDGLLLDRDGRVDLAAVRARLARRAGALPELRRVVRRPPRLAGRPFWVEDPDFRIERHVDGAEVAGPGDDAALRALVESLVADPLPRDRPLWRVWVISGLAGGRLAVLMVLHHAFADGMTAIRLARSLLETSPVASPGTSPARVDARPGEVAGRPDPSVAWLVADNVVSTLRSALRLLQPATWRTGALVARAAWSTASASRETPPSSLNGPVGPARRLEALEIGGAEARRVARRHGCGVHDVVLGLVAGGVRALLAHRGEDVALAQVRAGVAVCRFSRGRGSGIGNDIGTIHVALPVGEPGPVARLAPIAANRARALASPLTGVEPILRALVGRFGFARRAVERQRLVNLAVTYLPGPVVPIEVLGARVRELVPIAPLAGNIGLSVVALSYAGRLALTVRADAAQFPDLSVLVAAMAREWRLLGGGVAPSMGAAPALTRVAA